MARDKDSFNYEGFIAFVRDNNIVAIAIAGILSRHISEIINSFAEHIVLPVINKDGDKDGVKDITDVKNIIFSVGGMEFKIGKFTIDFLKFAMVIIILFIVLMVLNKIKLI